jgi:HK97 family phage prohead protease
MATPEKYAHIDFKPPQGAREEAEKSLAWRREFGRGGTAVGIARARDLANGVEVSPSTVRRMKAFFDRHQKNKSAPGWSPDEDGFPSNSRIAWAMWGSDAGWSWAKKVVEQMNAADEKNERGLRPYGSTHGMRPRVYVVHGAPCSGKKDYVASHLGENDVVFDYDEVMAAISGRPIYQPNSNLVSYCLDIRTLILKKALKSQDIGKTWVIATRVGDDMKSMLSDVPTQYVHIDKPKEECFQRLEQDEQRQPIAEELRKVIEEYFSENEEHRRAPLAQPGVERRFLGNFSSAERLDPELLRVEKRSDPETGKPQTYIVGYAARFHRDSLLLGDFVEQIDPGAFEIVTNRRDEDGKPLETRCLFNHDPNYLLGRFPTTMRMVVDDKGLKYECLLPEAHSGIAESIARGDLKGSSFSFVVAEGGERWATENGQSRRIVTKIKAILDCGPVTYPAYSDASVAVAKRSYEGFVGVTKKPAVENRLESLAKRAEVLRTRIAAEAFLAERRDCGRDEGGKFGSGNKCQEDEDGGEPKSSPSDKYGGGDVVPKSKVPGKYGKQSSKFKESDSAGKKKAGDYGPLTPGGGKDKVKAKASSDALTGLPKKKSDDAYVGKSGKTDLLGREESGDGADWLGRKPRKTEDTPTKIPASKKKDTGGYMEWGKGKDAEAQDFIDTARKGQLKRGGKDKGKSDDGSGVQTWSKGDSYPWTTKQVGDSKKGGYVQGTHPDGSMTEKYKFPAGSDGSEAYKQAEDEIKKKTIRSLRSFLEARR